MTAREWDGEDGDGIVIGLRAAKIPVEQCTAMQGGNRRIRRLATAWGVLLL